MDGIAQARDFLLGRTNETGYSRGFTAFATVYLDDVPEPFCGNFTVWPKSHRTMDAYTNIWQEWDGIREAVEEFA